MTNPAHAPAPQWLPTLAAYLSGQGLADPATLTLRPLSGGQSNPTYLLEDATGQRVLRKQPPGELLPSAHAVDREYRVMSALADSAVPVCSIPGIAVPGIAIPAMSGIACIS